MPSPRPLSPPFVLAVLVVVASGGLAGAAAQQPASPPAAGAPAAAAPAAGAARGEYLVHSVAMCVQCHSPRNRQGELLQARLLEGGSVPVQSPYAGPRWAFTAPNLKRIPGYNEEELVRLLSVGVTRLGGTPRGPMPPFRMSEEDARAIWSYLRSLRPES
jgi:mono/diheme cytochrome c family protein